MPANTKDKPQISMRHSTISAAEAAILAGELQKPSWQSKNEGIHERVSFEDSIWGFDLAGGSFYKTPLRVTSVKPDSRADKAGIRPGDRLLRINDIDTSTLTIQEAHEIIIESGVHLRIAVTSPDDDEDSYGCWQDPIIEEYDEEEERRKRALQEKKFEVHAKVSSYWSLQWPWVSKRRVIYRESNCFLVPSKYEDHHREKFPIQPTGPKIPEDIVLHKAENENLDNKEISNTNGDSNAEKAATETLSKDNGLDTNNPSTNGIPPAKNDTNLPKNNVSLEVLSEVSNENGNHTTEVDTDVETSVENNLSNDVMSQNDTQEMKTENSQEHHNGNDDTTEEILSDLDEISEADDEGVVTSPQVGEATDGGDELLDDDLEHDDGDVVVNEILSHSEDALTEPLADESR